LSITALFGDLGEKVELVGLVAKYLTSMYELGTREALVLLSEENKF
jgi:hypothetical protein